MRNLFFIFMLFSPALYAQDHFNDSQSVVSPDKNNLSQHIETSPELFELVVEMDKNSQGFRATHRNFQIQLEADPLVNGRLSLGFQYRLNSFLTLDIPVSVDHSVLGQSLGYAIGIHNSQVSNQWAMLSGVGLKIRLSEWMLKSSFYLETVVQAGYYHQATQVLKQEILTESIRIRPALYFGVETIFDTGFVMGAKIGIEQFFDLYFSDTPLSYSGNFGIAPSFNLGYAW
jgi:hypothetical protein